MNGKFVFVLSASLMMWASNSNAACFGYTGPGGPCYSGPGGPMYSGPGGGAYAGPGGPAYTGPGGAAGPGGPAYTGPGVAHTLAPADQHIMVLEEAPG